MANGNGNGGWKWRVADVIIVIFTAAICGLNAWMLDNIVELREFRAQGDRFTAADWSRERVELISEIRQHFPPRWLTERVDSLRDEIREVKLEQQRLQLQIDRLEGHKPKGYTHDE